jgi:hypothetical protein
LLVAGNTKEPKPTQLHYDYIEFSRTKLSQRKKSILGGLGGLFCLLFVSIGKNCLNAMITRIIRSDFVDFTYTSICNSTFGVGYGGMG